MATNSGRGNSVGSEDNPPTPDLHPPPVSDEFKKEVQDAEAGDATGKREAGHDESSSLPATSVATGEQAEKVIRTAADMGGK
ncbi:hypothetical protein NKR19_g879 [Coniochaeta hoffmannii]|uniref:Uncharacterized protein n=1 Tax=Coniochaeta hoffmannii TaxID=91930 RepID=A0AA38S898_9PEZI|nr:hypothetical protein NKR19_g879 [Coniochaeta hoffmannii]